MRDEVGRDGGLKLPELEEGPASVSTDEETGGHPDHWNRKRD